MQDMNTATNLHHSLQGAVIPSSGSVGMRIQYPLKYFVLAFNVLFLFPSFFFLVSLFCSQFVAFFPTGHFFLEMDCKKHNIIYILPFLLVCKNPIALSLEWEKTFFMTLHFLHRLVLLSSRGSSV